jgi:hypothetical protein
MGESKSKKGNKPSTTGTTPAAITGSKVFPSKNRDVIQQEMTYGKEQYKYVFIGLGLILLGLILMSGGWMPSPEVWDESIIYSARRTVLAPICILTGLIMQVVAIFKV